jgi:prepilin-type N-terminal cleavage/methylation domain-containing protein
MNSRRGFTLIELMIVVVIIGILSAIAVPKFNSTSRASKEAEATPILKQLYTLQERHLNQHGSFAATTAELEGGAGNFGNGEYYSFQLSSGGSAAYVACADPLDAAQNLRSFRIDATGVISEGSC